MVRDVCQSNDTLTYLTMICQFEIFMVGFRSIQMLNFNNETKQFDGLKWIIFKIAFSVVFFGS